MLKLTINEKDVYVEEGLTILEASQKAGVKIPTLCHDERLAPFGACRMCIVELQGSRTKFTPSCTTPVTEGMVIKTDSNEIKKARQLILELLLVNHPLDCPVCDKAGECVLQDLVYEYDIPKSRFKEEKLALPVDHISSLIERNLNRCILCGKCVRVCDEITDVSEISFINRGMQAKIGTDFDRPLDCEFCGQCIDACPVGALTSRLLKYQARLWELKRIKTICSFCSTGCSITLGVKDGRILEAYNEKDTGVNGRHLCSKGRFGWQYVHNLTRLETPLIKRNGQLVEASWDEALTEIAERIGYLKETYGSEGLAGLTSARLTNEEFYLFQKFMRVVLGTNNLDCVGEARESAEILKKCLGFAASTNSIEDIQDTDLILLIGGDVSSTNPVIAMKINQAIKKDNVKLFVLNSRQIKLAKKATDCLIVKPGQEVALLNGMINLIFQNDIFDRKFVGSKTEGSKTLKNSVMQYTTEYIERLTGINKEDLTSIVNAYMQANKSMIIIDRENAALMQSAINLSLLTGKIGQKGCGIIVTAGKSNSQGAIDMGITPKWLPGTQYINDTKARERINNIWNKELPSSEGLGCNEILIEAEKGKIKALYIIGANPIESYPNPTFTDRALKSLDFLVVQDIFLTQTAKLADVVLPAVSFAQKDGTFTNLERRIQRLNKAISPSFGRTDWEIIQELSNRLGFKMNYESSEEIMAEIANVVPFYQKSQDVNYDLVQWSDSEETYLYKDRFPKTNAMFYPVEYKPLDENKDFPFWLLTGESLFHSGSMSRYSEPLYQVYPEPLAEISVADAKRMEILNESLIKIISSDGSIEIKAKITKKSPEGVIFIPIHPCNTVFNLIKQDSQQPVRVRVEKV